MFKIASKKKDLKRKFFPWSIEMKLDEILCRTSSVSSGCKNDFFMEVLFILFPISIQETTKITTFSLVFMMKNLLKLKILFRVILVRLKK